MATVPNKPEVVEGTETLYLYIGQTFQAGKLLTRFIPISKEEIANESLALGAMDDVKWFSPIRGVGALLNRSPGAIYSVQVLDNGNRVRFHQPIPWGVWPSTEDRQRWAIQDQGARDQYQAHTRIKAQMDDELSRMVEPIRQEYRRAQPIARVAILARIIYHITKGV